MSDVSILPCVLATVVAVVVLILLIVALEYCFVRTQDERKNAVVSKAKARMGMIFLVSCVVLATIAIIVGTNWIRWNMDEVFPLATSATVGLFLTATGVSKEGRNALLCNDRPLLTTLGLILLVWVVIRIFG